MTDFTPLTGETPAEFEARMIREELEARRREDLACRELAEIRRLYDDDDSRSEYDDAARHRVTRRKRNGKHDASSGQRHGQHCRRKRWVMETAALTHGR
jgi:hypothetical protein